MRAKTDKLYTAKPSEKDPKTWSVWDMYDLPPKPIFSGTMEEAGAVADAKNADFVAYLAGPKTKPKES